ncbi:hypothetical protein Tsubulata_026937 [Turnera subulata]|uniref:Peptidoglycan binding-like domain-containing protein n=1 Tax=Turnera subulata TaxID=218843 RepID=A0A9Q0G074_9ROSI|nr:hypothetical protein Tsubulata_026937 [Turnera subulata]
MASKTIFFTAIIALLLHFYLPHAVSSRPLIPGNSPFQFIKPLQDSKKGDNKEGIQQLKQYLHRYGYLNSTQYSPSAEVDADLFDEHMERAIRIYLINFNLNSTGVLDGETVATMMKPRCGMADIIDDNKIGFRTKATDPEGYMDGLGGHILGLEHSSNPGAIMFPTMQNGTVKGLGPDDIAGIRAMYKLP